MTTCLVDVAGAVEEELAGYYGFPLLAGASSHFVTKAELKAALGDAAEAQPEWTARGGVWLVNSEAHADEDVFVGITIAPEIAMTLEAHNPLAGLDNDNLDAFCVLVEEVSHFHLILNRIAAQKPVTRTELELQGELDKLLVCARLLKKQSGDHHVLPLARMLYDLAEIVTSGEGREEAYRAATKYAARFWFGSESGPDDALVRLRLQAIYRTSWAGKLAELRDFGRAAA